MEDSLKNNIENSFDIIVIGAGHAGCEAGLAAARLGSRTLMLTTDMEAVAMMPCNPSIGGTGKGHLVREIDALGGEMGVNIDKTFIQSRMLNTAKGPAVHSLRAQADKEKYHLAMLETLKNQDNLTLLEDEVIDILVNEGEKPSVKGVITASEKTYYAKALVIATGTFLKGKIFIGDNITESGPGNLKPANKLSDKLIALGLDLRRFKTGTPARALADTFNYEKMIEQKGDERITPFSFMNDSLEKEQISCWLTYTNEETHRVIRENMHRSALFGGQIEGIGPRYCPSIEDKVNRFKDKERHQLFIEPEGLDDPNMYIQGMSSSLPEDVQDAFYHTIAGLENIVITKPAYAIEYDCIDPTGLKSSLETKTVRGLFSAGQFNGSSGYEEAASQGIIAGINAHLEINGREPLVLKRNEAYIGVLIDDLVTKGTNEPYRIMTSRAEYRLLLRQDNADQRLTEKSYKLGLATEARFLKLKEKLKLIEEEKLRLKETSVKAEIINPILEDLGSSPVSGSVRLDDLLRRPEISYELLEKIDSERPSLPRHAAELLEVEIKYEGYIKKQIAQVEKFNKMEGKKLPRDIDYDEIGGLRIEAAQKLKAVMPESLGQASRISGVSPADINVLMVYLEKLRRS